MDKKLLAAIDSLYSATLDETLWQEAMDSIAAATGGMGSIVLSAKASPVYFYSRVLEEANCKYMSEGWWQIDSMREGGRQFAYDGAIVHDRLFLTGDQRSSDAFVNEFWIPNNIGGVASYVSVDESGVMLALAVQRELSDDYFSPGDIERLSILGPHAARALKLANLTRAETRVKDYRALIERMTIAALVCESGGRVRCANSAFDTLCGECIDITQGRLRAYAAQDQQALDAALHFAGTSDRSEAAQAVLAGQDGAGRYVLQVFAMPQQARSDASSLFESEALLLVTITPAYATQLPAPDQSLRALGLTPAETRIAIMLAGGDSPNQIADACQLSVHTVRVHVKNIFGKLDVRRQSEVANLVTRLSLFK